MCINNIKVFELEPIFYRLGNNTQKLFHFRVLLYPEIGKFFRYPYQVFLLVSLKIPRNHQPNRKGKYNFRVTIPGNRRFLGIASQKLIDQQKCKKNFRLTKPRNHRFRGIITWISCNLRVTIPGNCSIAGSHYPEIAMKKPFLGLTLQKKNRKYFVG